MNTSGVEPAQSNMPKPNSQGQARNNLLVSSAVFTAIIVLPIVLALPALFNGRTLMPPGDIGGGLFDARILIGKILSNGQLPLWNPYAQAGIPLIAVAYAGALNPLNWIFMFFSPVAAANILAIITNQLAMAGCYLFARRINMSRPAAVIVGAIYALAALNVLPAVYIGNGATVMTAAWTPWVMLALENLYRRAEWRWVALGAMFLALQFFAGDVQISFYAFLLSVGYTCYLRIYRESSPGFLRAAAAMLLCGALFSMVQLLPIRESFMLGNNGQFVKELLSPHGVSSSVYPVAIYICALTTLSILVGLYTRRFSSLFCLWASVSIISVALSQLPTQLHEEMLGWIPIYGLFPDQSGQLYFSAFAMAILCGFAFTGLSKVNLKVNSQPNNSRWAVASAGGLIILAPLLSMLLMSLSGVPSSHIYSRLTAPDFAKFIISREKDEEGVRVIDLTGTVSNAGAATPREDRKPKAVSQAHGLRIINSPERISLPYLSGVTGDLKGDGAIGDRNLLMSYHQGLNLLNAKYLLLADNKPAPVEQSADLLNVDGVKFNRDKLGITLRRGNKVHITTEAGIIASEIALISHMDFSEQVADDAVVCVVRFHTKKDGILTREMRAGKHTAEGSYDKPETLHAIKHKKARVAVSGPPDEYPRQDYIAMLKFDRAEVNKIEIEHINPQPLLSIQHISLHDSEMGESVPITSRDLIDDRWRKVAQLGHVGVYENRATTSRAWFVARTLAVSESEMPEIIKSGVLPDGTPFDPRETVLINRMEFDRHGAKLPIIGGRDGATVTIDYSDTNRIELTTQLANQGYLVLSEPYSRGWDAFVDGERTPVNRVNHVLQGIPVAAGSHKVEFKYRPPKVLNGAYYALLGVLILITGGFVWRRSPRRVYSLVTSTFPSASFDNPVVARLRSLYRMLIASPVLSGLFILTSNKKAQRRHFALQGLVCASLALTCLAIISFPPAFETTITKATPESGYAWVASLPKTFPNALRFLYKVSNGDADAVSAKDMLLTEDGRRLPHGGRLHDEIRKSGLGRYSHWGSSLYFAASDNSNPNTNGRKYILRTTTSARGYIYVITTIAAGLSILFFCLYIGKSAFTELWLIGKGLPAELWRSAKKHHLALQELELKPASVEKKQNRSWSAYTKRFFRPPGLKFYARRFCGIWRKSGRASRLSLSVSLALLPLPLFLASCISLAYLISILISLGLGHALPAASLPRYFPGLEGYLHAVSFRNLFLGWAVIGALWSWLTAPGAIHAQALARPVKAFTARLARSGGLFCITAAIFLILSSYWLGYDSGAFSIAGMAPFSDGSGYWSLAEQVLRGNLWTSISIQRPVAAALRLVLLYFGQNYTGMLLVQAGALSLAMCLAVLAVGRWRGVWAGAAFAGLAFTTLKPWIGASSTEALGLILCLLSLPILITGLLRRSLPWLLVGLAGLWFTLLSRMGAMFLVPALGLWLLWAFRKQQGALKKILLAGAIIAVSGLAYSYAYRNMYSEDNISLGGNFAYIFCGMTLGGNWSTPFAHYPEMNQMGHVEQHAFLYRKAWENLRQDPKPFLRVIKQNITSFVMISSHYDGLARLTWSGYESHPWGKAGYILPYGILCLVIPGALLIIVGRRLPGELSMYLAIFLGIWSSSAIVLQDDGIRVLSSAAPLLWLIGASFFVAPEGILAFKGARPALPPQTPAKVCAVLLAAFLAIAFILPACIDKGKTRQASQDALAGGASIAGLLVVPNGAPLPLDVPALSEERFNMLFTYKLPFLRPKAAWPKPPFVLGSMHTKFIIGPPVLLQKPEVDFWLVERRLFEKNDWMTIIEITKAEPLPPPDNKAGK
jgi:hypothetical protein